MPTRIQIPQSLFKYLPPERIDVLTKARFRISQRQAVNDPEDFSPRFAELGTDEAVRTWYEGYRAEHPEVPPEITELIVNSPALRRQALVLALEHIKSPDLFGMLCLTETERNERMWRSYARNSRGEEGFVIELRALDLTSKHLPIWPVTYTDEEIPYLIGGPIEPFFIYKRTRWAEEEEWRGIIPLRLCPTNGVDPSGHPMHFLKYAPAAIERIYIREQCSIQMELRTFLSVDARYQHVRIIQI